MIDRAGQTWRLDGELYLVLLSAPSTPSQLSAKHETINLETGDQRQLWEFREHEWGESGDCASMRRLG